MKSGSRVLLWPAFFLLRRILLAVSIISIDKFFLQIYLTWLQLILALVILGSGKLFMSRSRLRMEYFNEVVMMWVLLTMFCFTPWVEDVELKVHVGFASCGLIILHFLMSLIVIFTKNCKAILIKCRLRKIKKLRDI